MFTVSQQLIQANHGATSCRRQGRVRSDQPCSFSCLALPGRVARKLLSLRFAKLVQDYQVMLAKQLSVDNHRILSFKSSQKPAPPEGHIPDENGLYSRGASARPTAKPARYIPQQPDRVLDAPELLDDFYLNILDWGPKNQLAVALGPCVYIWNGETGDVSLFLEVDDPLYISSCKWTESGTHLALGMSDSTIQLHDVERGKQLRNMRGHSDRVNALSWNDSVLSSAGRGAGIMNSDVRVREHCVAVLEAHEQEVCGLAWSPQKTYLASGGNDNLLAIWDARKPNPVHELTEHRAAVKALAWCPWQLNVLASGGGTSDHHVRIWNAQSGSQITSIDAKSQVCSLVWNPHDKELLGGLGYSNNQLCLWRYPKCDKVIELYGHSSRVLHMALSPDGCTVCSGAADETLRFWKIFEPPVSKKSAALGSTSRGVGKGSVLKSVGIR